MPPADLNKITTLLEAIHDDVLVIKQVQATDHELLEKHQQALYGNGKPGLVAEVRQLQAWVRVGIWAAAFVGGIFLTTIVGAFIYLIATHPISIMP